jgi:methylisocitrate lyase
VVELDEAVAKISMAIKTRMSDHFLVVARTDSRATHDLKEALRRGEAFLKAGADILFIEAPQSIEEMVTIKNEFPDAVLIANMVEGGKTPEPGMNELADLGFQIVLRPVTALLSVSRTLQECYSALAETGRPQETAKHLTFDEYNGLIGLSEYI